MAPKRILIVLGTRPEAIKLAPFILQLRDSDDFTLRLIFTGQHGDLVQPIFDFFGISAEYNLDIMRTGQDLHSITDRILKDISPILIDEEPDAVMVQGDTTTAYLAAHAAFYQQIPVVHVEAGLRSGNRYNPFPEEINRRLITQLSSVHLAATDYNRRTLLSENIPSESIHVTGNPVIDALQNIEDVQNEQPNNSPILQSIPEDHRIILLTTHRRENWGSEQEEIFHAVREITKAFEDVEVVSPPILIRS